MEGPERITQRLLDALHMEALLLTDEARSYFDGAGRAARDSLPALDRVNFACESLKLTARLLQALTWLGDHRAAARSGASHEPPSRIGYAAPSHSAVIAALPREARMLVEAGVELHERICRLDRVLAGEGPDPAAARTLISRLERAF